MPALCNPLTKQDWMDLAGEWWTPEPNTGCWLWLRSASPKGYGGFRRFRKHHIAHRFAFEIFRGPIPHGFQIDHLCRTPSCVNPDHMEAVTHRENQLRGNTFLALYPKRTHCKQGHEFTPENTGHYRNKPGRTCRECNRLNCARWHAEKRARLLAQRVSDARDDAGRLGLEPVESSRDK